MHRLRAIAGAVCTDSSGRSASTSATCAVASAGISAVASGRGRTATTAAGPLDAEPAAARHWLNITPGTLAKFYHPLIPSADGTL